MLMFFPLGCGSLLYSTTMKFLKSLILLLILCWHVPLRTPLCQVVNALSWDFPSLLSFMPAPLTLRFSHIARACLMSSHAEPLFISFATWFPFYQEGIFPRVSISYTCVLALSIGMFHCLELVYFPYDSCLLLVCNYKVILFFFKIFKYLKKSKKNQKTKKPDKERCYLWQLSSCVAFE